MPSAAYALSSPPVSARSPAAIADVDAVAGVLDGDRGMFEVIVRRYNTQLYRVGMAYLHDHAQTEDAMQNAYLKAFLNLGRFRGDATFATWLTRIMINECLMVLRAKKRFVMETIEPDGKRVAPELMAAPSPDPLHDQDLKQVLEKAVQTLPRSHRAVYLLREVQQLSTADTAACLGLSRENVKVTLHRAREGLKAALLKSAAGVELFDYPAAFCDPMTASVMRQIHAAASTAPAWRAKATRGDRCGGRNFVSDDGEPRQRADGKTPREAAPEGPVGGRGLIRPSR